ncbi:MAG: hypothetical protein ACI84K_000792 [Pseudohongiellaceae bacterium]|jgi:hypothetical protein
MQQILLSSQNVLPSQAKAATNTTGNPPFISQNKGSTATNNLTANGEKGSLNPAKQGGESSFLGILNGLENSEGNETMQSAILAEWKKLLNENPALRDQLEKNPEISGQIKAFIEGQGLSKEGEMLPPLMSDEGDRPLFDASVTNADLKTSDAVMTLQQVIDGFLSEQQANKLDGSSDLQLSTESEGAIPLGGELANISIPYILTDQNDPNIKAWGRFFDGAQAANASGSPIVNTTGMANAEYSTSLDRGGNSFGLMQGVVNSLQSETDAHFKASFDSFSALDSKAGDLLDSGRILERMDSSKSQFAEIQSKLNGASLKQYSTSLETNVQDPEWGDEMGQKIVWLTGRAIQSAEIHLNPADLGPIDVQIKVQNEQAVVTFHAQNSTVRDMLESNVHRLRDMMESNGVDLAEVTVGSEDSGRQDSAKDGDGSDAGQNGESGHGSQNNLAGEASDEMAQTSSVSSRIVDFYA